MATIKELLGDAYKDGMTFEEVETALSGKKIVDLSSGDYVSKDKFANSESRAKKFEEELRKRMTDDEKRNQELADKEERYKAIERENSFYRYKSEFGSTIKDSAVLDEVATAFADGNFADAIKKQNEYFARERENYEKQIKEAALHNNPTPAPQGDNGSTKKAIEYSMEEWNDLKEHNPQKYRELLKTIK